MATMIRLSQNGTRQPQVKNSSPEIRLKTNIAKLARQNPAGAPNCGQDAMKPRCDVVRAHSIDKSTEPPHSPPTPTPRSEERRVGKECRSRWSTDDYNNSRDAK